MKTILIIGAGKSANVLINALLETAKEKQREIILADESLPNAQEKIHDHPCGRAVGIDIADAEERRRLIQISDVVISMLPAFWHPVVAKDCLLLGKHFFSASYTSPEMKALEEEVKAKGLFFLNECGLDPGIDHMSAMKIIDREKTKGNKITLFKSYCGGLISPESEGDNPWKYKLTWNPRNVVLAGQGVSQFIRNGRYKFIPYHMLFRRTDMVKFRDVGDFDGYANRDSLGYRKVYGLEDIPTIIRGTLRRAGFCKSWDVLVQLGLTDDCFKMNLPKDFTMRMFINSFLPFDREKTAEEKIMHLLPWVDQGILDKIAWLGLFSNQLLPCFNGSPAEILQLILEEKWKMGSNDKDMVVMRHQFEVLYTTGERRQILSSLVLKGEDREHTAMAKTVGLPLAIAVDLFMEGRIPLSGVYLPTVKTIYDPILKRLSDHGIVFEEEVAEIENPGDFSGMKGVGSEY